MDSLHEPDAILLRTTWPDGVVEVPTPATGGARNQLQTALPTSRGDQNSTTSSGLLSGGDYSYTEEKRRQNCPLGIPSAHPTTSIRSYGIGSDVSKYYCYHHHHSRKKTSSSSIAIKLQIHLLFTNTHITHKRFMFIREYKVSCHYMLVHPRVLGCIHFISYYVCAFMSSV